MSSALTRVLTWLQHLGSGPRSAWIREHIVTTPRRTLAVVFGASALVWGLFGFGGWLAWDVQRSLPSRAELRQIGNMAQATVLFDRQDEPVFTIFKEQRIEVPLGQVSREMVSAVVAIEDQRFFEHEGVDLLRIVGAAVSNLREGRRAQGGSTITQQLAGLSFLDRRQKTYRRKLKEALLAVALERNFTKQEILELYLNKVYFGDGYYGVEAAANGFFGKPASRLDVAEAALLAGIIRSPSTWAPSVNLEKALSRRGLVLQAMVATRAIDRPTFERARNARVRLRDDLSRNEPYGQYFKEQVRRELVSRFGWERVSEGGLRVYTTIDRNLQRKAEVLVEKSLSRLEDRPWYNHARRSTMRITEDRAPGYLQAALVAMDPETGGVRAMVGGRNFGESRFNRAVQAKRQPGSAFKPFVYASAIEEGYSPATVLTGLDDPILTPQGAWVPEDEHSTAESMNVRTAIRTSSNRAAVRMLRTVGLQKTMGHISQLGFGNLPAVYSLALGAGEVTLESLTAAYGTFANGGILRRPTLIRRVEDRDGNTIYEADDRSERVFSDGTAYIVANMLQDVITFGTGARAREGFDLPAAGKTGTTNDYNDAWFVGFTPNVVMGVWVGFDHPQKIMNRGYGGQLAAPLWASVMREATRGDRPEWLERPSSVVGADVCRMSGKRPTDWCWSVDVATVEGYSVPRSMVYTEYFPRGILPVEECDLHNGPGFFERLAGLFGQDATGQGPPAVGVVAAEGAPAPATSPTHPQPVPQPAQRPGANGGRPAQTPGQPAPSAEASAEKPKKRGFWGKLFGKRDRKTTDEKNDDKPRESSAPPASEPSASPQPPRR
jgi:1A family penicillin-binding protein